MTMRNFSAFRIYPLFQRQGICLLGLAFVLTVLIYGPVMRGSFVWDDQGYFEANPLIRRLTLPHLAEIFSSTVYGIYAPLTVLSFALEYHFFHGTPALAHLNNVLLHLGVMFLVYRLALQSGVTERAAGMAALIFGIHPMHVEAVAWISARKDVLSTFFYLLALLQYMTYIRTRERVRYLLMVLCGLLSMLAKPMAASLPVILLLLDHYTARRLTRRLLLEKLPLILMIFPLGWITLSHTAGQGEGLGSLPILPWSWTFMFYIQKFFIPVGLCPVYLWPGPVSWEQGAYLKAVFAGAVLWGGIYILRNKKWVYFPFLFYLGTIFLVLRTNPSSAGLNPVADRFMYLPSLGFCIAAGAVYDRLSFILAEKGWSGFYGMQAATGAVVGALALAASQQALVWRDGYSLWGNVLSRHPRSSVAHCNLGLTFLREGEKAAAKKHFLAAARFHSTDAQNYNNLGNLFYEEGLLREAGQSFKTALRLDPGYAEAYSNYGVVLMAEGEYSGALEVLTRAAALAPGQPEILKNLGNVYLVQKKETLAEHAYLEALALSPASLYIHSVLGDLYLRRGDLEKAAAHFSEILIYEPDNARVHNSLGAIYSKQADPQRAVYHFREALRIDPHYGNARNNLNVILARSVSLEGGGADD